MHIVNFLTATGVMYYLQAYGYLVMFALMVIEGPIVTYVAAFLASMGFFHVYWVLILSITGSLIPDILLFTLGRIGLDIKALDNRETKFGKTLHAIISHIDKHPGKSIAIIKLVPGLPFPGLILCGRTKIKFSKFLKYILIVGIPYSLVFTLFGYYSGITFTQFSKYLKIEGIALAILAVIFVVLFYFVNKMSPKIAKRLEKDLEKD